MTAANELGLVSQPSWGRRLSGIEGLRGIAALLVLFRHVGQYTTDTEVTGLLGRFSVLASHGLTLFFVLSGFLLFRPFAAAVLSGAPLPSIRKYGLNRALRIYPAYVVIFGLVALVLGVASVSEAPDGVPEAVGRITDPTTLALDLALVQTYVPGYLFTGIGPAWSLTTEIAFYITLPLLAIAATVMARHRLSKNAAALAPALTLVLVGWVTTLVLAIARNNLSDHQAEEFSWGQNWSAVLDRSFLAQADLFGYGMLAAVIIVRLERRGTVHVPRWAWAGVLAGSAALPVLPALGVTPGFTDNVMGLAAAALLTAVLLPSRRGRSENCLARALEWLPLRLAGLTSYSIYLWHVPVIFWLRKHELTYGRDERGLVLTTLLAIAVTCAVSTVTYLLVERPAMQRRWVWPLPKRQPAIIEAK